MSDYDALHTQLLHQNISATRHEPMHRHTTFCTGGPAHLLVRPQSCGDLLAALRLLRDAGVRTHVIGNGSNILVPDAGVEGAVVLTVDALRGLTLLEGGRIRAGAGESLKALCLFALEHGLSGLEFAYGIPGTVGGALYMNAGAYGGEMKDVLESAVYHDETLTRIEAPASELALCYRGSRFAGSRELIESITVALTPGDPAAIRGRMDELLRERNAKQPVTQKNAGSTFKRPADGYAAALIEQCGLKGYRLGGAMVSDKHSGFIVNAANATSADILALIAHVRGEVKDKTGVTLEQEVIVIA